MIKTDLIIIGTGPVGLFTIFAAGILGLRCHVIDALEYIGGQCVALYPEKFIYDIPAYPQITGSELIEKLAEQAEQFSPTYHLGHIVTTLHKTTTDEWQVTTDKNLSILAKAIVIAAGYGAFTPNRPLIENLSLYENKNVFYSVHKRDLFKNKVIAIGGGGDSAIDWTIDLAEITNKIFLIHRREQFRCAPHSMEIVQQLVERDKVELLVPYKITSLKGDGNEIVQLILTSFKDNSYKTIPIDILLLFYGLASTLGPIADWGLALHKKSITVDPTTLSTDTKGIYAIGDMATYVNKRKLILCGFHEASMACYDIYKAIFPNKTHNLPYSTVTGIKKLV